ncbi:MAG: hypothetical protein JO001_21185 [Alphaproteobacteria bacterium]|nr:hypothetical protein [Alphaproteobacteria bacterium]
MRRLLAASSGMLLLAGSSAALAQSCDEYNPNGPTETAKVVLTHNDSIGPWTGEMRTFVQTGSIGKVDVSAVSARPSGRLRAVSAEPEISRISPRGGEQLKGIAIVVSTYDKRPPARVVVTLRQVCAKYFRDTFLYY